MERQLATTGKYVLAYNKWSFALGIEKYNVIQYSFSIDIFIISISIEILILYSLINLYFKSVYTTNFPNFSIF